MLYSCFTQALPATVPLMMPNTLGRFLMNHSVAIHVKVLIAVDICVTAIAIGARKSAHR
jgi:hypothetical protein